MAGWMLAVGMASGAAAADPRAELADYFLAQTRQIASNTFAGIHSRDGWQSRQEEYRRELLEMLGLWPLPERTDLRPQITGTLEFDDFVVEKLHFQSMPGLYVTANLHRPREAQGRLPAILYACGHAGVVTNGVSCGNKTAYQHHGIWFARHGYVCLLLDTLQLGEIQGVHHGTYRLGQWWWNSRGFTPAGVEAWNCMRAIDYMVSRHDVDPDRIGMTGRSGGGSYTWTTAAIDPRIRVAAPVAGITDLHNHVVDGVIEGHCDCMFFLNSHRWDFALNAALIAPRPLLIVNTDADAIFPLDGVQRLHRDVRRVYEWYDAANRLGLVIAPGGHKDTQDLQVPVFRWFNIHLRGEDPLITVAAERLIPPIDLRVFDELPADERNTTAPDWFGTHPSPPDPEQEPAGFLEQLRHRVFGGWPNKLDPVRPRVLTEDRRPDGTLLRAWEFESQPHATVRLYTLSDPANAASRIVLRVMDDPAWERASEIFESDPGAPEPSIHPPPPGLELPSETTLAWLVPRGIGPLRWSSDERERTHVRRRYMLLGQTLEGMRVWDVRRAIHALREQFPGIRRIELEAEAIAGVHALYAVAFEPEVRRLHLRNLPSSHREGPHYLNILQITDIPQMIEFAGRRGVEVYVDAASGDPGPATGLDGHAP